MARMGYWSQREKPATEIIEVKPEFLRDRGLIPRSRRIGGRADF